MQSQQPDNNNTNLLIAVVLSMLVMLGWQFFYAGPQMKAQQERAQREKLAAEQAAATQATPQASTADQASAAGQPAATRDEAIARTARVPISTPSLKGSIALKGGLIDDLTLVKYRETVDPQSANIVLLNPPGAPHAYFAEYGWQPAAGSNAKLPSSETLWKAEGAGELTPETPITLTFDNGENLIFKRTLSVDANYMFKIVETVENKTGGDVALQPYARLYRFGTPKLLGYAILHEGLIGVPGDAGLQEITYAHALSEGNQNFERKNGGWLGITDKYWATSLIPDQKATYSATLSARPAAGSRPEVYFTDYRVEPIIVPAGGSQAVESHMYAGAKQTALVEAYQEKLGIAKFDLMIDWGWFYFITKPLNHLIGALYKLLGNFGLAILAVTVLVKLAFFPLANKSYESMAKMKKLQPQMEILRDRFKDDKPRQQQELMQLYQKEKINPLAGCLPILIQIPVFFALYKVLFVSIDMRHAPFFGWIKDLSAPDPTSLFNLFGLLPFAVPEFLHIGVWPIIMGVTMWVQMQLNPPQPDPVQQQIFSWMPLLFTFLLASFPAGLVIYWAWNNILSIAQQWYISKKAGAEIHLLQNLQRQFAPVLRLVGLAKPKETKG